MHVGAPTSSLSSGLSSMRVGFLRSICRAVLPEKDQSVMGLDKELHRTMLTWRFSHILAC
jgi:hypothetical protein